MADLTIEPSGVAAPRRDGPRLTRRQVLISGGTAVGSLAILHGADTIMATDDKGSAAPGVAGIVERIELPDAVYVRNRERLTLVKVKAGAIMLRGPAGREQPLAAFAPGEEVVAEGQAFPKRLRRDSSREHVPLR